MFANVASAFPREVFKAKHRQTGKKVALKKVLMENEKEGVRSDLLELCLPMTLERPGRIVKHVKYLAG